MRKTLTTLALAGVVGLTGVAGASLPSTTSMSPSESPSAREGAYGVVCTLPAALRAKSAGSAISSIHAASSVDSSRSVGSPMPARSCSSSGSTLRW